MSNPIVVALEEGRAEVLAAVKGLSDERAGAKPAPDRWSALDCLEHLVVVEERFLGWIANGTALNAPQPNPGRESELLTAILDRSTKVQAPEPVHPTSRFTTLAEATEAFNRARDLSVRVAQERGDALYAVSVKHPRFGEMNGAELLHLMSGHGQRHAAQIREDSATLVK